MDTVGALFLVCYYVRFFYGLWVILNLLVA